MPDTEPTAGLLAALQRRGLVRFATLYVVAAWVAVQVADIALEAFEAPGWAMRALLVGVVVGFPVVMASAWFSHAARVGEARQNSVRAGLAIGVLAVLAVGLFIADRLPDSPGAPAEVEQPAADVGRETDPVIAVLPFTNMSSDAEKEFLADGLTEDIITLLAQSSGVEVVARNSTFKYKGSNPDIRAVGRDLGADYVVEGSLRPVGERIRVTVQVIDSRSGAHVWAQKYDRAVSAFFDVRDEVTLGIAAAVGDAVFREEYSRVSQSRTDDLNAWALTSRAEVAQNLQLTGTEATELARQAVAADPGYARAHAVLGRSLVVKGLFGGGTPADIVEGVAEVRHAAVLAPDDPRVVGLLAISLMWAGNPQEALTHAERAVELSPSYAEGLGYLGDILIHNGRSREALPYHDKALRLTPESSQRFFYAISKGEALIHHGDYAAAEETLASIPAIDVLAFMYLAGAQLMQGKTEQARASLTEALALDPERTVAREAEVMASYSSDEGGPYFKEMWPRLTKLEAELRKAH